MHAFWVRVSFPEVQSSVEAGRTDVQIAWPFWMRVLKCLAQAHSNDNTDSCRESDPIRNRRFSTLRCAFEVAYIFASVKAITVKFLVWEKTTRKELHPHELTSKVTTEFAYNGMSKRLHTERYCRIDVISELKCMWKMPSGPNKMQRCRRVDVTDKAVIKEFSCTQKFTRFQAPFGSN